MVIAMQFIFITPRLLLAHPGPDQRGKRAKVTDLVSTTEKLSVTHDARELDAMRPPYRDKSIYARSHVLIRKTFAPTTAAGG